MFCSNCGAEAEGNFCKNCGAPLPKEEPSTEKRNESIDAEYKVYDEEEDQKQKDKQKNVKVTIKNKRGGSSRNTTTTKRKRRSASRASVLNELNSNILLLTLVFIMVDNIFLPCYSNK